MPLIGYGTWKVVGDEDIFKVIDAALAANYRHIDTAVAYNNHRSNNYVRSTNLQTFQYSIWTLIKSPSP